MLGVVVERLIMAQHILAYQNHIKTKHIIILCCTKVVAKIAQPHILESHHILSRIPYSCMLCSRSLEELVSPLGILRESQWNWQAPLRISQRISEGQVGPPRGIAQRIPDVLVSTPPRFLRESMRRWYAPLQNILENIPETLVCRPWDSLEDP